MFEGGGGGGGGVGRGRETQMMFGWDGDMVPKIFGEKIDTIVVRSQAKMLHSNARKGAKGVWVDSFSKSSKARKRENKTAKKTRENKRAKKTRKNKKAKKARKQEGKENKKAKNIKKQEGEETKKTRRQRK